MLSFKEKIVAVTGGEMGIGKAIARDFSDQGAKVVIIGIDEVEGPKTAENLSREALFIKTDVSREEEVSKLPGKIEEKFGLVDVLVNNAGIHKTGNILTTKTEDWNKILDVNVNGVFLVTKYIMKQMMKKNKGVVVNVASEAGKVAFKNQIAYNVSKAAVISLTQSIAADFACENIRANAVCPGTTMTPLVKKIFEEADDPDQARRELEETRPLERLGKPEEIARAVLCLASEDLGYATGSIFSIDGGYTAV